MARLRERGHPGSPLVGTAGAQTGEAGGQAWCRTGTLSWHAGMVDVVTGVLRRVAHVARTVRWRLFPNRHVWDWVIALSRRDYKRWREEGVLPGGKTEP